MPEKPQNTIEQAFQGFLSSIAAARSENTARTYTNALRSFYEVLEGHHLSPKETPVQELPEEAITWFASALKEKAPTTESLYLTVAANFYEYLIAEGLGSPNIARVRMLIRRRARKAGQRLPQFPRDAIDRIIEYALRLADQPTENRSDKLRNLRDRAFLITLADTGLRVQEACALRRGDVDWYEAKAIIIGKGDRQAVVRFSGRAINALRDYLEARSDLDGTSGRPLTALPLFARHDRGAGKKVKPITTTSGRNIVTQRVLECLGKNAVGTITPHSFRHYFVTRVLQGSGGNLKLAQELARHRNITVTQRYTHITDEELDRGYWETIEQPRESK